MFFEILQTGNTLASAHLQAVFQSFLLSVEIECLSCFIALTTDVLGQSSSIHQIFVYNMEVWECAVYLGKIFVLSFFSLSFHYTLVCGVCMPALSNQIFWSCSQTEEFTRPGLIKSQKEREEGKKLLWFFGHSDSDPSPSQRQFYGRACKGYRDWGRVRSQGVLSKLHSQHKLDSKTWELPELAFTALSIPIYTVLARLVKGLSYGRLFHKQ